MFNRVDIVCHSFIRTIGLDYRHFKNSIDTQTCTIGLDCGHSDRYQVIKSHYRVGLWSLGPITSNVLTI